MEDSAYKDTAHISITLMLSNGTGVTTETTITFEQWQAINIIMDEPVLTPLPTTGEI